MIPSNWITDKIRELLGFSAPDNACCCESLEKIRQVADRIDNRVETLDKNFDRYMGSITNSEIVNAITDMSGRL